MRKNYVANENISRPSKQILEFVDNVANERLASNIETITVYIKKLEIYKEFNGNSTAINM